MVLSFEYWLLVRKPRHSAILLNLVFITPPALSCFVSLHAVLFVACFPVCLFHYGLCRMLYVCCSAFVLHALSLLFLLAALVHVAGALLVTCLVLGSRVCLLFVFLASCRCPCETPHLRMGLPLVKCHSLCLVMLSNAAHGGVLTSGRDGRDAG